MSCILMRFVWWELRSSWDQLTTEISRNFISLVLCASIILFSFLIPLVRILRITSLTRLHTYFNNISPIFVAQSTRSVQFIWLRIDRLIDLVYYTFPLWLSSLEFPFIGQTIIWKIILDGIYVRWIMKCWYYDMDGFFQN